MISGPWGYPVMPPQPVTVVPRVPEPIEYEQRPVEAPDVDHMIRAIRRIAAAEYATADEIAQLRADLYRLADECAGLRAQLADREAKLKWPRVGGLPFGTEREAS